jgi:two-component system OmpR family response regulator
VDQHPNVERCAEARREPTQGEAMAMAQTPRGSQARIVEGRRGIADEIRAALGALGFHIRHVETIAEGLDACASVTILDRLAGGAEVLAIVETTPAEGTNRSLLVISELGSAAEVGGLAGDGDDDRAKSLATAEFSARIEALARRFGDTRATKLSAGALEMDLIEKTVVRAGVAIPLMPRTFRLLEYLLRRQDRVVTRAALLRDVWGFRSDVETNVVDVHIAALRRKLDVAGRPSLIRNIRGVGFILEARD